MKEIKNVDDINLINDLLMSGETLESIGKREEFPTIRTIQRHIKKMGYKFNRKSGKIEPIADITDDNTNVTLGNSAGDNTSITPSVTKNSTNVTPSVTKNNISATPKKSLTKDNTQITQDIIKRLEILESLVLPNNTNVTPIKINSNHDIITRSIKVSKDVMSKFTELCENQFPMYSKQDIISTALLEFVEKYKN